MDRIHRFSGPMNPSSALNELQTVLASAPKVADPPIRVLPQATDVTLTPSHPLRGKGFLRPPRRSGTAQTGVLGSWPKRRL
jgi:hypothetical protein